MVKTQKDPLKEPLIAETEEEKEKKEAEAAEAINKQQEASKKRREAEEAEIQKKNAQVAAAANVKQLEKLKRQQSPGHVKEKDISVECHKPEARFPDDTDPKDFDYCFKFHLPDSLQDLETSVRKFTDSFVSDVEGKDAKDVAKDKTKHNAKVEHLNSISKELSEEMTEKRKKFAERAVSHEAEMAKRKNVVVSSEDIKMTGDFKDAGKEDLSDKEKNLEYISGETALALFKSYFISATDATLMDLQAPEDGHIDLLTARRWCLSMFINFFRRNEELYHTFIFKSLDSDELFLCVKMLTATLQEHAQESEYPLRLSKAALTMMDIDLDSKRTLGEAASILDPDSPAMKPGFVEYHKNIKHLFARHRQDALRGYNWNHRDGHNLGDLPCCFDEKTGVARSIDKCHCSIFSKPAKIRLLYDRITDVLNVDAMMDWGLLLDYFPLHNKDGLTDLLEKWANMNLWLSFDQPIEEVQYYFGESVALYFVLLTVLCRHMKYLVGVSCCVVLYTFYLNAVTIKLDTEGRPKSAGMLKTLGGWSSDDDDNTYSPIFLASFTILWCQVFVLNLKKEVKTYMNKWGTDNPKESTVKSQQNVRFAPMATLRPSEEDANKTTLNVPRSKRVNGKMYANVVTFFFITATLCTVASIFALKAYLLTNGQVFWATMSSYLLTIQIKVFASMWITLSAHITDYEYHSCEVEFCNALSWKMYMFEFINDFSSFYYIAFFMKEVEGECPPHYGTCWNYLTYQMIIVFGIYLIFTLYDILYPMYIIRAEIAAEVKKLKACQMGEDKHYTADSYSYIEQQSKMGTYNAQAAIDDYLGVVGPLSFVLVFGITMPLSSLLLLLTVTLQIRADAWKLTRAMQRPYPLPARLGLGVWLPIMESLTVIAMVTNVGLICYTVKPFVSWPWEKRLLMFFTSCSFATVVMKGMVMLWPEVTWDVELARNRHEHQRELALRMKAKENMEDDDEKLELPGCPNENYANIQRLEKDHEYFESPVLKGCCK